MVFAPVTGQAGGGVFVSKVAGCVIRLDGVEEECVLCDQPYVTVTWLVL